MTIQRALADLEAARSDVARLEAQLLHAQARVAKLQDYVEMARQYEAGAGVGPAGPPAEAPSAPPFKPISSNARVAAAEVRAAILRAVIPRLRHEVWTPSLDLVPFVQQAGLLLDKDTTKVMVRLREVLAKMEGVESGSGRGYRIKSEAGPGRVGASGASRLTTEQSIDQVGGRSSE